ncbi:MAG: YfcE family phosphodiesterase [Planctomycetota bacterium]|nr:YfcE family phosphodiesterase [Planctomycetota bacterium]
MRIGILGDSHGRIAITARAVEALLEAGAETLIHLGDIEDERVIDELAGHRAHLVFGNCDWDTDALARHAERLGVIVDDPIGRLEVASRRMAFTHGHRPELMRQALEDGIDYLLHGHTHELRDERVGSTRIINPGALFRARRYTAAVLDPAADALQIIDLDHRKPESSP